MLAEELAQFVHFPDAFHSGVLNGLYLGELLGSLVLLEVHLDALWAEWHQTLTVGAVIGEDL